MSSELQYSVETTGTVVELVEYGPTRVRVTVAYEAEDAMHMVEEVLVGNDVEVDIDDEVEVVYSSLDPTLAYVIAG